MSFRIYSKKSVLAVLLSSSVVGLMMPSMVQAAPTCAYVFGQVDQTVATSPVNLVIIENDISHTIVEAQVISVPAFGDDFTRGIRVLGFSPVSKIEAQQVPVEERKLIVPRTEVEQEAVSHDLSFGGTRVVNECVLHDGVATPAPTIGIPATAVDSGVNASVATSSLTFNVGGQAITIPGQSVALPSMEILFIPAKEVLHVPGKEAPSGDVGVTVTYTDEQKQFQAQVLDMRVPE